MTYRQIMKPGGILAAILLGVGLSPAVFGATAANTPVNNQATVNYEVNTEPQGAVDSNTETFYVDIAADFAVATNDTASVEVETSNTEYTSFTLTNNSNDTLYFTLAASNNDALTAFDGGDADDGVNVSSFVIYDDDSGGTGNIGTYDADETVITSDVIQVAGNGGTRNILVAADAPVSATDQDDAVIELAATVTDSAGAAVSTGDTADGLTDGSNLYNGYDTSVEFVLLEDGGVPATKANGAEDDTGDNDGVAQDTSAYRILAANIQVNKSNTVIDDTLGGTDYHVPGATMEYTISIENLGSTGADNVSVVDAIDTTNLTYLDDDSAYGTGDIRISTFPDGEDGGVAGECDGALGSSTVYNENAGDGSTDDGSDNVLYDDTNDEIEVQSGLGLSVPADQCVRVEFQVTIN